MAKMSVGGCRIHDVVRDSKILWDDSAKIDRELDKYTMEMCQVLFDLKQDLRMAECSVHDDERDLPRNSSSEQQRQQYSGFTCNFDEIEYWFHEYMENEACSLGLYHRNTKSESIIVRFKRNFPVFDGTWHTEDFRSWVDDIEDFFEEVAPPVQLKCRIVLYKMEGAAYEWWKQIQYRRNRCGKEEIISWPRMKNMLLNKFSSVNCSTKLLSELGSSKANMEGDGIIKGDECSKENAKCNESNEIQTTETFTPQNPCSIVNAKPGNETEVSEHSRADEYISTKCSTKLTLAFVNNEQYQRDADLDDLEGMTDVKIQTFMVTKDLGMKGTDKQSVLLFDAYNKDGVSLHQPQSNTPQFVFLPAASSDPHIQEMINKKIEKIKDSDKQDEMLMHLTELSTHGTLRELVLGVFQARFKDHIQQNSPIPPKKHAIVTSQLDAKAKSSDSSMNYTYMNYEDVILFDPGGDIYLSGGWGLVNYLFSRPNILAGNLIGTLIFGSHSNVANSARKGTRLIVIFGKVGNIRYVVFAVLLEDLDSGRVTDGEKTMSRWLKKILVTELSEHVVGRANLDYDYFALQYIGYVRLSLQHYEKMVILNQPLLRHLRLCTGFWDLGIVTEEPLLHTPPLEFGDSCDSLLKLRISGGSQDRCQWESSSVNISKLLSSKCLSKVRVVYTRFLFDPGACYVYSLHGFSILFKNERTNEFVLFKNTHLKANGQTRPESGVDSIEFAVAITSIRSNEIIKDEIVFALEECVGVIRTKSHGGQRLTSQLSATTPPRMLPHSFSVQYPHVQLWRMISLMVTHTPTTIGDRRTLVFNLFLLVLYEVRLIWKQSVGNLLLYLVKFLSDEDWTARKTTAEANMKLVVYVAFEFPLSYLFMKNTVKSFHFPFEYYHIDADRIDSHDKVLGGHWYCNLNITRGRIIPWEGWNDEYHSNRDRKFIMTMLSVFTFSPWLSILWDNGPFKNTLRLFFKLVDGLDPPNAYYVELLASWKMSNTCNMADLYLIKHRMTHQLNKNNSRTNLSFWERWS